MPTHDASEIPGGEDARSGHDGPADGSPAQPSDASPRVPAHEVETDRAAHGGDQGAGPDAGGGGAHAGGHGEGEAPELENLWNILAKSPLNKEGTATHRVIKHFDPYVEDPTQASLHKMNQNVFFSLISVGVVWYVLWLAMRRRAMIPGRLQSAVEMVVETLSNFFLGILGEKHGRRYLPFLLALFLFILVNNLLGLVPFMKSSTNLFQSNIVLGLCVFFYVQYSGLRYNGPKKYFLHMVGNPEGAVMWLMSPLMLVLEVLGELIKPVSLSLRLFGNIMGEDILLGVFAMLGIMVTGALLRPVGIEHVWLGIPLHFPFLFLAALTSTIQALIFSLLSCVYILLMLPHDEEER
jgi:F-type H+-transporting ATPase subunit a